MNQDQVDLAIGVKTRRDSEHENEKLTASPSSGSLIITDCGGESSTRSTGSFEKNQIIIRGGMPLGITGFKILSLVSMTTAIVLIGASGVLLHRTHQTLVAWLKAEPTTMNLLAQVNNLLGGTTGIVEEVRNQEKYLKILILCSAILVITGLVQLLCNIWFFCRMNAQCIRRSMSKTEQFFCGL